MRTLSLSVCAVSQQCQIPPPEPCARVEWGVWRQPAWPGENAPLWLLATCSGVEQMWRRARVNLPVIKHTAQASLGLPPGSPGASGFVSPPCLCQALLADRKERRWVRLCTSSYAGCFNDSGGSGPCWLNIFVSVFCLGCDMSNWFSLTLCQCTILVHLNHPT